MSKYINADEFIKLFKPFCYSDSQIQEKIDEMPSADVRENIHGEWIRTNPLTDTFECSLCGYNILSEELITPFCPWCGADMRERKEAE